MATANQKIVLKMRRAAQLAKAASLLLEDDADTYVQLPLEFPVSKAACNRLAEAAELIEEACEEWNLEKHTDA